MINSREELLEEAKKIESHEERAQFILNYFLENVSYNYAYLFAKGYAPVGIENIEIKTFITLNQLRVEGDEEFSIKRNTDGNSRIINDILKMKDECAGDYQKFISSLRAYVEKEISSHLDNPELVEVNTQEVILNIEADLRKKEEFEYNGVKLYANNDISKVFVDYILELSPGFPDDKKHFKPEFKNGLIVNGVCENYTDYLVPLLKEAGIEAYDVEGTSELGHAWVIARINGEFKSIDLTRSVFIRDGFKGIPKDQTSQDWLYTDLSNIFDMQETRSISKIDDTKLPEAITGKNYSDEKFKTMMKDLGIQKDIYGKSVEYALRSGIVNSKINEAEAVEKTETKEKVNPEVPDYSD